MCGVVLCQISRYRESVIVCSELTIVVDTLIAVVEHSLLQLLRMQHTHVPLSIDAIC